jgi:hypothetical protein
MAPKGAKFIGCGIMRESAAKRIIADITSTLLVLTCMLRI